jgi:hypothetical protein
LSTIGTTRTGKRGTTQEIHSEREVPLFGEKDRHLPIRLKGNNSLQRKQSNPQATKEKMRGGNQEAKARAAGEGGMQQQLHRPPEIKASPR